MVIKMSKKTIIFLFILLIGLLFYLSFNTYILDKENDNNNSYNTDLFKDYYKKAEELLDTLNIDEKISQLLLIRHPQLNDVDIQKKYQFGGMVFFERDFKNKAKDKKYHVFQC